MNNNFWSGDFCFQAPLHNQISKIVGLASIMLTAGAFSTYAAGEAMNPTINTAVEILSQQQTITVKGVIVDENGEPIVGANVLEDGTTNGTITDLDGNFTLDVSPNAKLKISYIGYLAKEVVVNDSIGETVPS